MRKLILAAAVAGAAFALPTAPASAAACRGVVDVNCYGLACLTDCFYGHCLVWVDPSGSFSFCINPL